MSNPIPFAERCERKFRRIVCKKDNTVKISQARKDLDLPNGEPQETITISRVKKFHLFFASLLLDEKEFLKVMNICKNLLTEIDLDEIYLYPMLIYLYTGTVIPENFVARTLVIQSKRMSLKMESEVRHSGDKLSKLIVAGKLKHLKYWPDLYPISIKINPLASIEEIIGCIRRSKKEIKKHQLLYGKESARKIPNLNFYQTLDKEKQLNPNKSWDDIKKTTGVDMDIIDLAKSYAKGKKYLK